MLFWIWIFLIVLAIVVWFLCSLFDNYDEYAWTWILTLIVGTLGSLIAIVCLANSHVGVSGYTAKMHTRHDMLVYQYENNVYDNDNDLGKRDLIEDIQSWNEDLSYYKQNQRDFWIGIFIPNVYDQFEFIELSEGELK